MEHLERIKERIEKGEKLARKTYTNSLGVQYARKQSKEKYLEIAKQTGSFVLHKWSNVQRVSFFNSISPGNSISSTPSIVGCFFNSLINLSTSSLYPNTNGNFKNTSAFPRKSG